MSKEVIIRLRDDLDQSLGNVQTVEFGWAGKVYEIDLGDENRGEFEAVMSVYVAAARPKKVRKRGQAAAPKAEAAPPTPRTRDQLAARRQIREWARANGFQVNNRGAIPQTVIEAWESRGVTAHG